MTLSQLGFYLATKSFRIIPMSSGCTLSQNSLCFLPSSLREGPWGCLGCTGLEGRGALLLLSLGQPCLRSRNHSRCKGGCVERGWGIRGRGGRGREEESLQLGVLSVQEAEHSRPRTQRCWATEPESVKMLPHFPPPPLSSASAFLSPHHPSKLREDADSLLFAGGVGTRDASGCPKCILPPLCHLDQIT